MPLGHFCILVIFRSGAKLVVVVFYLFANDLKARNAVVSENEPKFESAEPFAQRNLPVLKIIFIASYFNNHFLEFIIISVDVFIIIIKICMFVIAVILS